MYNRKKMNYECLDPCRLDDNGNSLVDMISNEPETSRKRKVMETLKDLRVPGKNHVTNDENMVKLITYEDTSNGLFVHLLLVVFLCWCLFPCISESVRQELFSFR